MFPHPKPKLKGEHGKMANAKSKTAAGASKRRNVGGWGVRLAYRVGAEYSPRLWLGEDIGVHGRKREAMRRSRDKARRIASLLTRFSPHFTARAERLEAAVGA